MRVRGNRAVRVALRLLLSVAILEGSLALGARILAGTIGVSKVRGGRGSVVCVGDSNTFGIGAPAGRAYPDQLRELFRSAGDEREVASLGAPGFTTYQIVDRLENALRSSRPDFVLFLGGNNDLSRGDIFLELRRPGTSSRGARLHALASRLRTFRILEAAYHKIAGHKTEAAYGGSTAGPFAEPWWLPESEWDRSFDAALARGIEDVFPWLLHFWRNEDVPRARRAFDRLRADPAFADLERDLTVPVGFLQWELDMLAARPDLAPLPLLEGGPYHAWYAAFTHVHRLLETGRPAEAREALALVAAGAPTPYAKAYVRLHDAWASLLARDFGRADEALRGALDASLAVSPNVGLHAALGGSALAFVLRDERSRLSEWRSTYGAEWDRVYGWNYPRVQHEWMLVAEWVDAAKSGDAREWTAVAGRARARFGPRPVLRALADLLERDPTDFATLRADLPLETVRTPYWGGCGLFWRPFREEELDRLLQPNLERFAGLAERAGFRPVVLTYLNYEATLVNDRLRRFARSRGWTLVDMEAIYGREELAADGKTRYFSEDRAHPNERGYGLVARAVFDALGRLGPAR